MSLSLGSLKFPHSVASGFQREEAKGWAEKSQEVASLHSTGQRSYRLKSDSGGDISFPLLMEWAACMYRKAQNYLGATFGEYLLFQVVSQFYISLAIFVGFNKGHINVNAKVIACLSSSLKDLLIIITLSIKVVFPSKETHIISLIFCWGIIYIQWNMHILSL